MDDFFETPARRIEPQRPERVEPPPWVQPPRDVIAVLVPDRRTLVKTDRLTILLTHIDAFPTGASLRLRIMARWSPDMSEDEWAQLWDKIFEGRPGRSSDDLAEFLRIGVLFADGRKATNLEHVDHPPTWTGRAPQAPSLVEHGTGSSGGDRFFAQGRHLWLWPLPPPEPFDLVIEWPAFDLPVTRTSMDGASIVAAARGAEPAWQ